MQPPWGVHASHVTLGPMTEITKVAIVGAGGYTGAELVRIIASHPRLRITVVTGHSQAGLPLDEVLPAAWGSLRGHPVHELEGFDADRVADLADVALCALPHGASATTVADLRQRGMKVLDLSADFRLTDPSVYERWYGDHGAPDLFGTAAYGLVELFRPSIAQADLIAVPGCFPTAAVLGIAPILKAGLCPSTHVAVDAKSGMSGAGRKAARPTHFPEVGEGVRAYKSGGRHRHLPEIEQALRAHAGSKVNLTFTPHLVPMIRGILSTAYIPFPDGSTVSKDHARACTEAARRAYADDTFIRVLEPHLHPDTTWVRGSNATLISYTVDVSSRWLVVQCVIDNLVKGAAGQAVQCLNVRMGWDEGTGLTTHGLWP